MKLFDKSERSSFPYWFAHWCAFQMTALCLRKWKWRYLWHDWEKPWLMLLWKDYKRVQRWHRKHRRHHIEYPNPNKIDWEALVIDWECSRFTKESSPLTAREEFEKACKNGKITSGWQKHGFEAACIKLGL